jgi:hypothetical protein
MCSPLTHGSICGMMQEPVLGCEKRHFLRHLHLKRSFYQDRLGTNIEKIEKRAAFFAGEKGYFRIKRGNDECGIASSAVASSGDAKWVPPSL